MDLNLNKKRTNKKADLNQPFLYLLFEFYKTLKYKALNKRTYLGKKPTRS